MNNDTFPGFAHAARELFAYVYTPSVFIIGLRELKVIHHHPADAAAFRAWLDAHEIMDITNESADNLLNPFLRAL